MAKPTERDPVAIFDDTEELAGELSRIAGDFDAAGNFMEAYWLKECEVSMLGMYEDLKAQQKQLRRLRTLLGKRT